MRQQDVLRVAADAGFAELGSIQGYGGQLVATQQTGLRLLMASTAVAGTRTAGPHDQTRRDTKPLVYEVAFPRDLTHDQVALTGGLVGIRGPQSAVLGRMSVVLVVYPVDSPTTVPTLGSATAEMRVAARSSGSGQAGHLVRQVTGGMVQLDSPSHAWLSRMAMRSTHQAVAGLARAAMPISPSRVHLVVREAATAAGVRMDGPADMPDLSLGGSGLFAPMRELPSRELVVGRATYPALPPADATMPSDSLMHLPVAGLAVIRQGAERRTELELAMAERPGRAERDPQRSRRTPG